MGFLDIFKKKKPEAPKPPEPEYQMPEAQMPELPEFPELPTEYERPEVPEIEFPAPEIPEYEPEAPEVEPPKPLPVREEQPAKPKRPTEGPIFVSSDDYRKIMDKAHSIKDRLTSAEELFQKIGELKMQEEKEFEKWRNHLETIEKQLSNAETMIAQAR